MSLFLKEKARKLRSAGKTYSEIRKRLKLYIPKSTLSTWCKGVVLDETSKIRINKIIKESLELARVKARDSITKKRQIYIHGIYKANKNLVKNLKKNEIAKIALAMLYLGEGSKTKRGAVMFGNSDPNIIALFLKLLRQCYDLDEEKFRFTLQCREDQDVKSLENYWSKLTAIPLAQCYKVQVDPRTKGKPSKKQDYKGVCRIDYFSAHIDNELKIIADIINQKYSLTFGPVV